MRDVHASRDNKVYVILRVFQVERERIGLRVYVDPEQARVDGRLLFTGETWSIVPGVASANG